MNKIQPVSVLCVVNGKNAAGGLKLLLNGAGVSQVFATEDADDVFDIVSGASIDVLLIQDDPPEIDGVELCREIRNSPNSPDIKMPVILIMKESSMKRTVDATTAGVNEMLVYPFSARKLLQRLTAAINDEREFIQVETYVGPDRRFLKKWDYRGPMRRRDDVVQEPEEEDFCSEAMKKFVL